MMEQNLQPVSQGLAPTPPDYGSLPSAAIANLQTEIYLQARRNEELRARLHLEEQLAALDVAKTLEKEKRLALDIKLTAELERQLNISRDLERSRSLSNPVVPTPLPPVTSQPTTPAADGGPQHCSSALCPARTRQRFHEQL